MRPRNLKQVLEMTFILIDLCDKTNDLQLANGNWWPVASEIRRSGIVVDERAETLEYHLCTHVSSSEAAVISAHLSNLIHTNALVPDIDYQIAQMVADFAASSSGFEVC